MTEIASSSQTPSTAQPAAAAGATDVLMNFIIGLLTPMFLGMSAGNQEIARLAAIDTINDYRARNRADLMAIMQIVSFGFAATASVTRSMSDGISDSMALRLRRVAIACERSAEQNRRALDRNPMHISLSDQAACPVQSVPPPSRNEKPISPMTTPTHQITIQAGANPEAAPSTASAPSAVAVPTTKQHGGDWATAMIAAARKMTTGIENLPPAERRVASLRAATLTSTASELLSGLGLPPLDQAVQAALRRPASGG